MSERDSSYEEKADEVREAPGEGAGWEGEAETENETERADK